MTTTRRIGSLNALFFSSHAHLFGYSGIFCIDVALQPEFGNARYSRDACQSEAFQQQFVNQIPGGLINHSILRVLHKLSAAVSTLKVLFAVVNSAILDSVL